MLQTPDGNGRLELFQYVHPEAIETEPTRPSEIGMHRVAFSVDDVDEALEIAARHGCHPLRGVATYEDLYRLTYVRGPSGILVMLAEELGFALLLPEQRRANNHNGCFNWFKPDDAERDCGEARSIFQMIDHMVADHDLDQSRIFVTGLSAGGAMAAVIEGLARFCAGRGIARVADLTGAIRREETDEAEIEWAEPAP